MDMAPIIKHPRPIGCGCMLSLLGIINRGAALLGDIDHAVHLLLGLGSEFGQLNE